MRPTKTSHTRRLGAVLPAPIDERKKPAGAYERAVLEWFDSVPESLRG